MGHDPKSRATLPILYHNNSPIWNDTFRLQVPIDKFQNGHIRLEFRHCSAKDKNDKKLLSFAYVHLMEVDETTIKGSWPISDLYEWRQKILGRNSEFF